MELVNQPDIKAICISFKIKIKAQTKPALIETLLKHCSKQTTLFFTKSSDQILKERIINKLGKCVKLSDALYKMFFKLHLLYSFATPDFLKPADLHQYLRLIMYGDLILPKYTIDCVDIFESIEDFERYLSQISCLQHYKLLHFLGLLMHQNFIMNF